MKSETKKAQIISFIPDGDYYFDKGLIAYQKGDLIRAKKFCERAIAFNPKQVDYLCQHAAILAELEEYDESNKILKQVIKFDPEIIECHFFMANNYAHLGYFDESLTEIKEYIAKEPNGPFMQEARELYKLLTVETENMFQEEPEYIINHEKGRLALDQGDYKKAIMYFKKVIKQQSKFWAAYNNLALAYYSRGDYNQAFSKLNFVLRENPGNIHALCNLTILFEQLDMHEELIQQIEFLKKLYPIYPEHRSKLGSTLYLVGEYDLAYKWLRSAEKSGSHWESNFYYWLSLAAFKTGHESQAMKAWNKVLFFREGHHHPFDYGKIRDMIRSEDAYRNPMVRSLIEQEVQEGELAPKLFSLFLLRRFADDDAKQLLNKVIKNKYESSDIRWIARQLQQLGEEGQNLASFDGDLNIDNRMKVMLYLEQELGHDVPLVHAYGIYDWWFSFVKETTNEDAEDYRSWAAALIYLYKKGLEGVTQGEISELLGISTYRIRKYSKELKQMLEKL